MTLLLFTDSPKRRHIHKKPVHCHPRTQPHPSTQSLPMPIQQQQQQHPSQHQYSNQHYNPSTLTLPSPPPQWTASPSSPPPYHLHANITSPSLNLYSNALQPQSTYAPSTAASTQFLPSSAASSTQYLPSYSLSPPSSPPTLPERPGLGYMRGGSGGYGGAGVGHSNSYPAPSLDHGNGNENCANLAPVLQGNGIYGSPEAQPQAQSSRLHLGVGGLSSCQALSKTKRLASKSMTNLNNAWTGKKTEYKNQGAALYDEVGARYESKRTEYLNQGAALCDVIGSKLDAVITRIDGECFSGDEKDLVIYDDIPPSVQQTTSRAKPSSKTKHQTPTLPGSNYFAKSWLYSNSRLPPHQPPLKLYLPTWPLLCLAAQYSERVYERPKAAISETEMHVEADWRRGTKAMVLKSIAMDDAQAIVFAVRGSQTFMDWAVNFRPAPSSPEGFLDDPGNLCHAGFLGVARSMIKPVAARLRTLIEENPTRSNCSLIITGHSAGGAVAALLYAHMFSTTIVSELTHLVGVFKRVHCVTFGAPPVSLLPLTRSTNPIYRKSLFFSFVNEGDPVARADRATVTSLLNLYKSPAPPKGQPRPWNVPTGALSLAGTVVVLRKKEPGTNSRKPGPGTGPVEACVVTDEKLRKLVYGDPVMHMMRVYVNRIEELATRAVTAQGM